MVAARDNRGVALRLGGAVALFLLLVGQAQVTVLDGNSMLAVAQSIVHDGSLAVRENLGVPGHDGTAYYSKYGLLLPLLSIVPVLVAQPIGALTGRVDLVEAAAAASIMPLVGGALAGALFLLGRRLGAPRAAAALVGAGIVLGTYLLPYGRDFFTEPLVALGLVVMVERALAGHEQQAAVALAAAVLARPQSAAFAPLLLGFMALRGDGVARDRANDPAARDRGDHHRRLQRLPLPRPARVRLQAAGRPGLHDAAAGGGRRAAVRRGEVAAAVRARARARAVRARRAVAP